MSRRHTDTSTAAYNGIVQASERLRAIVYQTLHANPGGLTVDETCALAEYPRYSLQPRFPVSLAAALGARLLMMRFGSHGRAGRRRRRRWRWDGRRLICSGSGLMTMWSSPGCRYGFAGARL